MELLSKSHFVTPTSTYALLCRWKLKCALPPTTFPTTHYLNVPFSFPFQWRARSQTYAIRHSYYCRSYLNDKVAEHNSKSKKKLVFMGSPTVAADVLEKLLVASHADDSIFNVSAIVTQPPSGIFRGRKNIPCPVAQRALDKNFPSDRIFTPEKAGEETFLAHMRALKPDLCVTAAYGNILPNRFLEIPKHGTVNIHPSLLPLYRGAAPVQRALQDGVKVTGVSVAFTVRALDAGPIIASESLEIDDSIKAPDLLAVLFDRGTCILLRELPSILNSSAASKALEQDESVASLAPKVSTEESWLCFDQPAWMLHNKVRAFAGWPGTRTKVAIRDDTSSESQILELKIITTKLGCQNMNMTNNNPAEIMLHEDALIFCCGGGSTLKVLELQLPGKKVMDARSFWNGLRGRKLFKA